MLTNEFDYLEGEPFNERAFLASLEGLLQDPALSLAVDQAGNLTTPIILSSPENGNLAAFVKTRLRASTPIDNTAPVISICGKPLTYQTETLLLAGLPGCGKTAFDQMLIAVTLNPKAEGCEGIEVAPNTEGHAVLHFESEQSNKRQIEIIRNNLRRAGIEGDGPEWYCSHTMLEHLEDMLGDVELRCAVAFEMFGGIHSIHIDGGAECCLNTQELEPSKNAMARIKMLGQKYKCAVVVVIHTNPGVTAPPKARGHFGSEAERLCASEIIIMQDENDVSKISPKKVRHTGKKDFPNLQFKYDIDKGYYVTCGAVEGISKEEAKAIGEAKKDEQVVTSIFKIGALLTYEKAVKEIQEDTGVGERTAQKRFASIKKSKLIEKTNDLWHIKIKPNEQLPLLS
jgi:hypothetical protein